MHTVAEYNSEIAWCTVFSIKMALHGVLNYEETCVCRSTELSFIGPLMCKGRLVMTKSPGVRWKPTIINIGYIVLLSPPEFC